MNHQERFSRENLKPGTLALVRTYYTSPRREKILECCARALEGADARACRDALCPHCCPRESFKIARKQYARFLDHTPAHKAGPRLAHEVYTLPPHLHARIRAPEGFAAWKRATLATIREVHQADVAGVMNLHPIGDNLARFHPHWDVVVNGYVLGEHRARQHRPPRIHYDDARAIYKRHLVRELQLPSEMEPREVNVFLDRARGVFQTAPRKTWHMVRYSARHVYQPQFAWLNDAGTGGDWWYRPSKRGASAAYEGRDVIGNLLRIERDFRGRKRRVWFGYLQNRLNRASAHAFRAEDTA